MNKLAVQMLSVLRDGEATTPVKSMSLIQIVDQLPVEKRKSSGTNYRRIRDMIDLGYVEKGLTDSYSDTYYITAEGLRFIDSLNT